MSSPTPSETVAQSPAASPPAPAVPAGQASTITSGQMSLKEYLALKPAADRRALLQQVAVFLALYHVIERLIHGNVKLTSVYVDEHGTAHLPKGSTTVPITTLPRAPANPQERLPMTTATDVYAFAWLVFHVYTDIDPQELARNPSMMRMIASGVKPNRPAPGTLPAQRGLSDRIWAILLRCWDISPVARPSITEVVFAFDLPFSTGHLPPPPPYEARAAGGGGQADTPVGTAAAAEEGATTGTGSAPEETETVMSVHDIRESVDRARSESAESSPETDVAMPTQTTNTSP
ncbi:hypothetical protein EXIGLDRAFT_776167 [Exidia glandulosa HHB12029]|uniref:Protein kinase domain-containing protein n=1 Tax=Exidia glandulosa HHB12029 TaxID=1314781 RepID=A0A165DKW6_EXIGL|nr:hypothetical protein EXIGLDRAFT_776167 [Exidia glandulosa HHB12029]